MANAVQTTTTVAALLEKKTPGGLVIVNEWIREFPELAYFGFDTLNIVKNGGKLDKNGLTFDQAKLVNFKSLGTLEADMTIEKNEVVWYEVGRYAERAKLTAPAVAATVLDVEPTGVKYFAVDDVVMIARGVGSTTANLQTKVTAVNVGANTITVADPVTAVAGDLVIFSYNLVTYRQPITRQAAGLDATSVRSYFQKFGQRVEFDHQDINQTRLIVDAQNYAKYKFAAASAIINNNLARAWFLGRNVGGNQSETQGLEAVIQEQEARFGNAIYDLSASPSTKETIKSIAAIINEAASANIYNGNEMPSVIINTAAVTEMQNYAFDLANFFKFNEFEIEFGLIAYKTPFFRNVTMLVSSTLDRLSPNQAVMYVLPKHMVAFRTPMIETVNDMGALVKTNMNALTIHKQPQTSPDFVEYDLQYRIANIFGGQTVENAYKKIILN